MSDTPNDDSGDGSEGEQSEGGQPEGGQPQGGQPQGGQPQGGRPQGGQPAQGQPQGGQPQGGQPQGQPAQGQAPQDGAQPQGQPAQGQAQRAPVNTGPSVSDIFSRNDTLDQIKLGVVMYAIVGFGVGLPMFGLGSAFTSGGGLSSISGAFAVLGTIGAPLAVSAALALLVGRNIGEELDDVMDNLVFATAGVTTAAGTIIAYFIAIIMLGLGTGTISFDNLILPIVLGAIGSAIIAAGSIWAEENLLGPSGVPPQQGQQQY